MKKLSILATLALVSASTAAFADPDVQYRDHRHHDDDAMSYDDDALSYDDDNDGGEARFTRDRDGHYWQGDREFIRQESQARWVSLGSAGSGRTAIKVGAQLGRFQSLKLDASGFMRVRQVVVNFADGTSQRVRMASAMNRRSAPLVIDLGGKKQIRSVMVYAAQFGRGSVSISGLQAQKFFWRRMATR